MQKYLEKIGYQDNTEDRNTLYHLC